MKIWETPDQDKLSLLVAQNSVAARKLLERYVIFITQNDIFGKGQPLYQIQRCILGTGEIFGGGYVIRIAICDDEKYHGAMSIKAEGTAFILSVLLILPQHSESIPQQIG